jgi:DNA-binding CsgD family transcriptional regulator
MDELERFSRLVEDLYDAAMGNASFAPLGPRIAAALGSESCSVVVLGGTAAPVEALALTDNCLAALPGYSAYYHKIDPWAALGASQPANVMVASQDHISDPEFRRTEFYQDHCRPSDTAHVLGAVAELGGPDGARAVIGIHRAEDAPQFSAADKRRGTLLLPHLRRAIQLRERLFQLDIGQRAMTGATEALGVGVLVVSGDGQILSINPVAEMLVRRGNGLGVQQHRLAASQPVEDDALRRLMREAAGRALNGGGLIRLARQGLGPLVLSVYPFTAPRSADGSRMPAALIFVADPDAIEPPRRAALARMYRLTQAEARLFEALLAGERLQDYAERNALSVQTAKTQLARLFQKTGHARQIDLVRDALSNPILRAARP